MSFNITALNHFFREGTNGLPPLRSLSGSPFLPLFCPQQIKYSLVSFFEKLAQDDKQGSKLRKAIVHFLYPQKNIKYPLPKNNLRECLVNL